MSVVPRPPPSLCVRCKGVRRLCGLERCPILERARAQAGLRIPYPEVEAPTPPLVLVGEAGYPKVRVGPTLELGPGIGDPRELVRSASLEEVVRARARTLTPTIRVDAGRPSGRWLGEVRLAAMGSRPAEVEAELERRPNVGVRFDGVAPPSGPSAPARRVRLAEEPRVPPQVERAVYDADLRAAEAVLDLYISGVDVYHVQRLLSLGLVGTRGRRRLVPTRWAITAVDSILGDALRREVLDLPWYSGPPLLHRWSFAGNEYRILILPGPYGLEVFEAWLPGGLWSGRSLQLTSNYEGTATPGFPTMDGGHYAMRLPVLERLREMGRQAAVVAVRQVGPSYYAPVGSWQIRESVRAALSSEPTRFDSAGEALGALARGLDFDLRGALSRSRTAAALRQRRLPPD